MAGAPRGSPCLSAAPPPSLANFPPHAIPRWSEFVALLSLSTTLFLFLQTRDLSYQLSAERLRHTAPGESGEGEALTGEATGASRAIHRELNTAQEEMDYGKVRAACSCI